MNIDFKKCSSKKHEKDTAVNYCKECRLYLCEKCLQYHKEFYMHQLLDIKKDTDEIFNGICKEENHLNNLEYYCKNHNQLCCDSCIVKFKKNGKGVHSECDICPIEDIKDEMKNKLNDNIKLLEELSNSLEESINELKKIFDNINQTKETLKSKIQKKFTKLRNSLNMQEDEILLKVDKKFEDIFFKEEIIRKCERLPKRVAISLEKGKLINKIENNSSKLNIFVYDCINLENNIKDIKIINENIKKCKSIKPNVKLYLEEEEINNIISKIKLLGQIYYKNFDFANNANELKDNQDYIINGENKNIITKISEQRWICFQSQNNFEKDKKYIWKIKILKSKYNNIMVGISPNIQKNNNQIANKLNLSFIDSNISVEKYTIFNPYTAYVRDNIIGEEFDLLSETTYRINISAKKIFGNINLQGGIWYTSQTQGESFDNFSGFFRQEKQLNNGYIKYYKDVKVPPGKQKGKFYFQIEQDHEGGLASWYIADISISQLDNNSKTNDDNNYGYYLYLRNSSLYSDSPYNYRNEKTNLQKIEDEVTIIMDMSKRTLAFNLNNEEKNDKDVLYNNIPIEKPLYPTVVLYNKNDSIAFLE